MRYESAAAFRQALEQRLRDRSRRTGESPVRLRKTVMFDRLLARLSLVAPERWMLKGALAIDYRLEHRGRTTKDLDSRSAVPPFSTRESDCGSTASDATTWART